VLAGDPFAGTFVALRYRHLLLHSRKLCSSFPTVLSYDKCLLSRKTFRQRLTLLADLGIDLVTKNYMRKNSIDAVVAVDASFSVGFTCKQLYLFSCNVCVMG